MNVSGASASSSSPFVISEAFSREYGCTQDEWLRWMPEAVHGHAWTQPREDSLQVSIGQGELVLDWQVLAPRAIALIRLPRMTVNFRFSGVSEDERKAFMKRFDLHLQRGGG
jgi:hypothetical protein